MCSTRGKATRRYELNTRTHPHPPATTRRRRPPLTAGPSPAARRAVASAGCSPFMLVSTKYFYIAELIQMPVLIPHYGVTIQNLFVWGVFKFV
jgi:hypothetical protein